MRQLRIILWIAVAVALIAAGYLLLREPRPTKPTGQSIELSSIGGPFTLVGADGQPFSSAKLNGKPYRYCPITVLEPVNPMGDTLDFSQESIQRRMRHGEEVARATLRISREQPLGQRPRPEGTEPMPPLHS